MPKTQLTPKQLAGLAADLMLNFGNGTPVQAVRDGRSEAVSKGLFKVGSIKVQWASTVISLGASGGAYAWSVSWPEAFASVLVASLGHNTGWTMATFGGLEALTTTGANGNYRSNEGTFPRNCTIYVIAIGT